MWVVKRIYFDNLYDHYYNWWFKKSNSFMFNSILFWNTSKHACVLLQALGYLDGAHRRPVRNSFDRRARVHDLAWQVQSCTLACGGARGLNRPMRSHVLVQSNRATNINHVECVGVCSLARGSRALATVWLVARSILRSFYARRRWQCWSNWSCPLILSDHPACGENILLRKWHSTPL